MQDIPYSSLIGAVIGGINALQGKSRIEMRELLDGYLVPPNLPAGENQVVWITSEGLRAVEQIAVKWRRISGDGSKVSVAEAKKAASKAIGRLITSPQYASLEDALTADQIRREIDSEISDWIGESEHFFKVHLFRHHDTQRMFLGPVCLETGNAWKDRVLTVGPDDHGEARHLADFASAPWIGSVSIKERSYERSIEHASICIRVALDALALPLSLSQSREIRGPSDSFEARRVETTTRFQNGFVGWSGSREVFGLRSSKDEIERFLGEAKTYFQQVGDIVEILTGREEGGIYQSLKRRWIESMYWFGDSRRSQDDFIGIVKIGIALDILSGGGQYAGIVQLCQKLWGVGKGDVISSDGRTVEKIVDQIYQKGRSQISHGGRFGLLEDLPILRLDADKFASKTLMMFAENLHSYSGPDDPRAFRAAA